MFRRVAVWTSLVAVMTVACPSPETSEEDAGGGNGGGVDAGLRRPDAGGVVGTSSSGGGTSGSGGSGSTGSSATAASSAGSGSASSSVFTSSSVATGSSVASAGASSSSAGMVSSSSAATSGGTSAVGSSSSSSSTGGTAVAGIIYVNSVDRLFTFNPTTEILTDLGTFSFVDQGNQPLSGQRMLDIAVTSNGTMYGITYDVDTPAADFYVFTVDVNTRVARRLGTTKFYSSLGAVPAGTAFTEEVLFAVDDIPYLDALRLDTGGLRYSFDAWSSPAQVAGDVAARANGDVFVSVYDSTNGYQLAQVDTYDGSLTEKGAVGHPNVNGLAFGAGTLFGFTREGLVLRINVNTGAGTIAATHTVEFVGAAAMP